ncbi:hypothetical protein MAR_021800, partial [Mya arenaria]
IQDTNNRKSPSNTIVGSRNYSTLIGGILGSALLVAIAVAAAMFWKLKRRKRDVENTHALRKHTENKRYEEITSWSRRNQSAGYTDLGTETFIIFNLLYSFYPIMPKCEPVGEYTIKLDILVYYYNIN